jgi:hypothetical protein
MTLGVSLLAKRLRRHHQHWFDPCGAATVGRSRQRPPYSLPAPSWSTTVLAAGKDLAELIDFLLDITAIECCDV